jgi:acetolactate synthase-1/2/3 large subunit
MTNAEAIARVLAGAGVEHAFGLPGGEVVVLIDALRRAGIRFHLVGHEASAAFAADVTGQITGRPGVCVSTLGPGAANLVTGIAGAWLDRSPVLALTATISADLYPSFPHQRLALDRLFAPIAKQSVALDGTDTGATVAAAFELARTGRPGPVHVALSSELAGREETAPAAAGTLAGRAGAPGGPAPVAGGLAPASAGDDRDAALRMLREARRPLLHVGLGARPEDAGAIRRLLDATQWPWVTTPKAKGIVPETHPRFLGVASGMAIDRVVEETLDASDLVIGVGFDPVEYAGDGFIRRPTLNISRWPTAEGAYRPTEIIGEIGLIVSDLVPRLKPRPWPEDALRARRRALARDPRPPGKPRSSGEGPAGGGVSPLGALRALREVLPEETVVSCDVGSHKLLLGQFWTTTMPHTFFMSNGLSSMGYGVPAAMAAALHFPGRPIAALVGDGGMLMMVHTLPLLASLRLPVLIVVFTDGSLSLIRYAQTRRGLPVYGTGFQAPDFVDLAASFGIDGARAERVDEVRVHAGRALGLRAPFVLDVRVDLREYEELL